MAGSPTSGLARRGSRSPTPIAGHLARPSARPQAGDGARRHRLATILFTDIVGSTERAAQLGDRRWREILEAHDRASREELKRYGGRAIKSLGDGLLAVFDGPVAAIRCARAM